MSVCCFDLLPYVCHCHLQLFALQFDVPVINKIKIRNSYLASLHNFHFQKQSWSTYKQLLPNSLYRAARFCKLRRDFGFFSSVNHLKEGGGRVNENRKELNALAQLGMQKQNWHETENDF